jgi:hypothetical protein
MQRYRVNIIQQNDFLGDGRRTRRAHRILHNIILLYYNTIHDERVDNTRLRMLHILLCVYYHRENLRGTSRCGEVGGSSVPDDKTNSSRTRQNLNNISARDKFECVRM